jgi:D-glutamate N-acetyltransferase
LSLNTSALDPAAAERTLRDTEQQYGLPTVDPLRTGVGKIVDALAKI